MFLVGAGAVSVVVVLVFGFVRSSWGRQRRFCFCYDGSVLGAAFAALLIVHMAAFPATRSLCPLLVPLLVAYAVAVLVDAEIVPLPKNLCVLRESVFLSVYSCCFITFLLCLFMVFLFHLNVMPLGRILSSSIPIATVPLLPYTLKFQNYIRQLTANC